MKLPNAQLIHQARRKCNGATVHIVEQLLLTYPILLHVHNKRPSQETEQRISDLEERLYALAQRR